jgi:hypothetical protein
MRALDKQGDIASSCWLPIPAEIQHSTRKRTRRVRRTKYAKVVFRLLKLLGGKRDAIPCWLPIPAEGTAFHQKGTQRVLRTLLASQ